jgi:hypothetical protein
MSQAPSDSHKPVCPQYKLRTDQTCRSKPNTTARCAKCKTSLQPNIDPDSHFLFEILMKYFVQIVALSFMLLGAGCDAKNASGALGIVGYNYTDRAIAEFSVNGNGGGNIYLSSPDSGGGKTVCCMSVSPGTKLPLTMEVQWTWDRVENEKRKVLRPEESRTATAVLTGPLPTKPTQFEVHFYPDGHVEVAVSDNYSPPRLKLERKSPLVRQ